MEPGGVLNEKYTYSRISQTVQRRIMKNIKKTKVYENHIIKLDGDLPVYKLIERLRPYQDGDWRVSFSYYVDSYVDHFYVYRWREETDEEYNKRLEVLETQKRIKKEEAEAKRLRAKEKELKEYERLKKKFGE